jgi:NAD(P) transhydrogenase subunit alpha
MTIVATLRERASTEHRVALTPAVVRRLIKAGFEVWVEPGAGHGIGALDAAYEEAGAAVKASPWKGADVVAAVGLPPSTVFSKFTSGQVLVGLLGARVDPAPLERLADKGIHPVSLDLLPRQVSRAQTMDALTSQASVAGYRAVLVAANAYGSFLPMMVTAAGTAKPAKVLVMGAGVAGLQAIGTARRLGAQVTGYDVRPDSRQEVKSLGAAFLETSVDAVGEGGYARELTAEESATQRAEIGAAIAGFDVVITTAQVPGRKPPELVSAEAVAGMRSGSVLVDLAASELGGNVAGSLPDRTVVTTGGVTVIGAGNLPSAMAPAASEAYARNIAAVIEAAYVDGQLSAVDEVIAAMTVASGKGVDL